jgi:formylglycine-generating enzyme required for sulfatase activity
MHRLRGDLDWVVLKCLAKDRTRRYGTVAELAADIQRHLDHEPVAARAPSVGYRIAKLSQRYRGQLVAAATVLLALVGGLGLATSFWLDAAAQATAAKRHERIAQQQARDAEAARAGEAANAKKAAEQTAIAQHNAEQAAHNARAAERLLAEVLPYRLLAGIPHLQQALDSEATLYPPWPTQLAGLRKWVNEASRLIGMQPEIAATLAALRAQALPANADDIERARMSHPRYGDLQRLTVKLAALDRAQEIRAGKELSLPLPAAEEQAMSAAELNGLAWPRVDPDDRQRIWGEEARALVLARLAWDKSAGVGAQERALLADTLAWAWFANGKDAAALAMSKQALALAPEAEKESYANYLAVLQAKVAEQSGDALGPATSGLRQQVAALTAEIDAAYGYRFADESKRFLYDTLRQLGRDLNALQQDEFEGVQERLAWAEAVADLTARHRNAPATWAEARAAISRADGVVASELYAGQAIELRDEDVVGLVPIGMNPATKLWEFYDLRSAWDGTTDPASIRIPRHPAPAPDRVSSGDIAVGDDTGIVFVLLPGGTFTMGAQNTEPAGPNYDAHADAEGSPHRVILAPFFLARHELTQGQWKRLTGEQPSYYAAGSTAGGQKITWAHPVENIDWLECDRWLSRHGMALPTEAQWEYGCRAGTTTPWWSGAVRESLRGVANLADQTAKRAGVNWRDIEDWPDLDDGFAAHAPVDALRPNGFGLHHVHGNVWEWCADAYGDASAPHRGGDGLRQVSAATAASRVDRGGCFNSAARDARAAYRFREAPTSRYYGLGARPARALRRAD